MIQSYLSRSWWGTDKNIQYHILHRAIEHLLQGKSLWIQTILSQGNDRLVLGNVTYTCKLFKGIKNYCYRYNTS